jgi:hypothetical protein
VSWLLVGRAGVLAAGTAGAAMAAVRGGTHTAPIVVFAGAVVVAMAAWLVPVLLDPALPAPARGTRTR